MANLKIGKSCGSCLYFKHQVPDGENVTHEKAGYKPYDKPCTLYEPAVPLVRGNDRALSAMSAIKDICDASNDPETLEAFAQMLTRASALKAAGYGFLQKVYYRWRGSDSVESDYLDNWVTGYLLNITASKVFWITSADNSTTISAPKNRVLTIGQFRPIYKKLVSENRLRDKTYKAVSRLQGDQTKLEAAATAVRSLEEIIGAINLEGLNIRSLKVLRQEEKRKQKQQKTKRTNSSQVKGRSNRSRRNELDIEPSSDPVNPEAFASRPKARSKKETRL